MTGSRAASFTAFHFHSMCMRLHSERCSTCWPFVAWHDHWWSHVHTRPLSGYSKVRSNGIFAVATGGGMEPDSTTYVPDRCKSDQVGFAKTGYPLLMITIPADNYCDWQ